MGAARILAGIALLLISLSAKAAEDSTTAEVAIAIGTFVLAFVTTGLWIATHRLHKGAERSSVRTSAQMPSTRIQDRSGKEDPDSRPGRQCPPSTEGGQRQPPAARE